TADESDTVHGDLLCEGVRGGPGSWRRNRPGRSGAAQGTAPARVRTRERSAAQWRPAATLARRSGPVEPDGTEQGAITRHRPKDLRRTALPSLSVSPATPVPAGGISIGAQRLVPSRSPAAG